MQRAARHRPSWLGLIAACLAATVVIVIGAWAYQIFVRDPAALKAKQAFILNPANQPAILKACQTMLANPKAYQHSGTTVSKGMPPALAALGSHCFIVIYPDGVLIVFGRSFGLWATPPGATAPHLPMPTARLLIPDLWYLTYPGN